MKVFTSNRGAVSVFLVIILVPTLLVTSIFVDVSRMFLGKSVTESAGDLALNSQLSQFDEELNDLYGLFATAKDVNDVSDNLNKYFESCLISAGVETTDASRYGATLSDLIDEEMGEEYSDLLKISVSDDAKIETVGNGNLGNPQVLKNQIVNFMKYRGPVDIAQNFMDRMTNVKDKVDIVDDEAEVTDKMNSFLESQNNVLDNLNKAYQNMKNYQQNGGMNETYVNNLKTELSNLESNYKAQHKKMFKDLYNTQGIGNILTTPTTINKFQTKLKSESIKDMDEDEAERNFDKYVKDAQKYVDKFESTYDNVLGLYNTYIGQYAQKSPTSKTGVNSHTLKSDVYPIQWYVALSKEPNKSALNDFGQKANDMNYYVARAYKAQELSGKTSDEYSAMIDKYRKYAENPNRSDKNNEFQNRTSLYVVDAHIEPLRNLIKRVYNNNFKNNISTDSVDQFLKDTSKSLKDNYKKINEAKKLVTDANTYLEKAKTELINNTNSRYNDWEKALDNSVFDTTESDVAKSSEEAIESEETKEFREKVTESSINAMISRLNNIETLLQNMLDLIDSYQYNGKKVKDINSYSTFKNSSGINSNNIVINKSTLESNANNSFKFSSNLLSTVKVDDNNNPDLEHIPIPALYEYLKFKFIGEQSESEDKNLYEDVKEFNDKDEDISSSDDNELSSNEIATDNGEEDEKISKKISNIADNLTGLFGGIGNIISNPTTARDDLYVLDYVMNMFSYHTYNKEGIYNLALKDGVSGLDNINKVKNLGSKNSSSLGCTYAEAWKNEKTTFTDNKTLTNHMINLANNYSFGNEVEYILNGKNNSANKSAMFAKIFMIRYAFDLGPQFSYHWDGTTGNDLNVFAVSVNSAFPFIPTFLVKTVTVLALTAAEAASDLNELKEGMKVKLVKDKEDLKFTFSVDCLKGLVNDTAAANSSAGTPASELNSISYFQYSDYLSIFLFLDLINTNKENEIMTNIGNVIARNVGLAKGYSNSDGEIFDMSDAHTYYCLTTKVQVQPLLLSLPMFQDDKFSKSPSASWWTWEYSIVRGYN